jgi:hypothetical protein
MNCPLCGCELPVHYGVGRQRKYCGERCRRKAAQSNLKTYTCNVCGREFQALHSTSYCSRQCKATSCPRRTCQICGATIDHEKQQSRKPRKYCEICRPSQWDHETHKHKPAPPLGTQICRVCGKEFDKKAHHQRSCSLQCEYQWRRKAEHERQPLCKCQGCGITFRPKRSDRMQFHSQECALAFRSKQNRITDLIRALSKVRHLVAVLRRFRSCPQCGNKICTTNRRRFCSDECRKAYARIEERSKCQRLHDEITGVRRCYQCAAEFTPSYPSKRRRFCSARCAKRFGRRIRQRRTRARKWKTSHMFDRFADWEIFERDGWLCQICLQPIDRTAKTLRPMAATLDHIIPLSRGGTHTRGNVQTAHRRCNSLKRELLPFQPELKDLIIKLRKQGPAPASESTELVA